MERAKINIRKSGNMKMFRGLIGNMKMFRGLIEKNGAYISTLIDAQIGKESVRSRHRSRLLRQNLLLNIA